MPRPFDPDEQQRVRAALIEAGRERFTAHGLGKVTVGELTEACGIGKGTFYLFFDSKEALFFAVQEEEEAKFKIHFEGALSGVAEGDALLERFFTLQLTLLERQPFLRRLLDPGTLRTLARKVDPEALAAHQLRDRRWIEGLVAGWKARGLVPDDLDGELVYALSGAGVMLSSDRTLIGPRWEDVARTLARALARELTAPRRDSPSE